jgi:hypothetical protein
MNKFVATVSLVALSAATVRAQSSYTQPGQNLSVSGPPPKWWNIAATVRGFYDDNANTAPNGSTNNARIGTFGYEVTPSVGVDVGNQQTTFSAGYAFHFLYYEKALSSTFGPHGVSEATTKHDMDHTFTAALSHAFTERYSVHVTESFVIGQQPDALRAGNAITVFQRIPGDNIVNAAGITFDAELTPVMGLQLGYNNALYDYHADELSGPLNRIENYAHADLRWTLSHQTVGVVGYQFGDIIYTGSGPFANPFGIDNNPPIPGLPGISIRDTISHTGYIGADHQFLPNLTGTVRGGVSYYDYYHDSSASDLGPYAQVSLTYTFAPESTLSIGFNEARNASSLTGVQNGGNNSFVHDTETSVLYGGVVYRIIPRLYGSVRGTFQNSTYHGGGPGIDGESDRFYEVETDLEYRFCPNFSVHGGYIYDQLCSSLAPVVGPRNYDRNKFYIGATASY